MGLDDDLKELEKLRSQKKKQLDRQNKYINDNYDRIGFTVPKGQKEKITDHYKQKGFSSMSEYLTALIANDLNK